MYYFLLRRNWRASLGNSELHAYWAILLGSTLIIAFNILPQAGDFLTSLRLSFFQVSTIMTTTGYATADFNLWPQLSRTILVMLMLIGSSAGSTAAASRWCGCSFCARAMVREIRRTVHPRSVNTIRFDGRAVDESVISSTLAFFFAYIFVLLASTLIVSLDGFSFETNFTAVVATLSNIGPGLDMVGPMGNFSQFSDLSKIVLSLCMLIGRLEVFPILMLAAPERMAKVLRHWERMLPQPIQTSKEENDMSNLIRGIHHIALKCRGTARIEKAVAFLPRRARHARRPLVGARARTPASC